MADIKLCRAKRAKDLTHGLDCIGSAPFIVEVITVTYDEFEAEMIEAGWSLDEVEASWQKHLANDEDQESS